MKKTMAFVLVFLFSLHGFAQNEIIYFFGKLSVVFAKVDQVFVNKTCVNKKCLAYKSFRKFKDVQIDPKLLYGGKNPNSVRCSKIMGGEVIIGRDLEGNQQSVCQFKDNSFLF